MNILFIVKTPPPITGATIINQYVTQIKYNYFKCKFIKISYKKNLNRNLILISFIKTTKILFKLLFSIFSFKPRFAYFQISPIGLPFYRDCVFVFILKLFRVKIIYHLHGKGIYKKTVSCIAKNIYKWAFQKSYVICLSEKLSEDIKNVHTGKIYIVNNGIPIYRKELLPEYKTDKKFKVLFLSHLQKSKGILIFLDVVRLLLDNEKYKSIVNAKIIGSELDVTINHLVSEIIRYNINNNVEILGQKFDSEKMQLIANSDVLVYPTLNDAFPLVILEAMQFGIPVIASREGAIPEIVDDGITGFLVDKNNPDQIKEKLITLIENQDLRYNMGVAARKKFMEKYTLEIFEKNMVNTLNQIIQEKK